MSFELLTTQDGSHTIRIQPSGVTYHSIHGALTESQHVFLKHGLMDKPSDGRPIRVFEMGFGTGLNALLAMMYAESNHTSIEYISIEQYPVPPDIYTQLNYTELLETKQDTFLTLHTSSWNEKVQIAPHFNLHKINAAIEEFNHDGPYDLVFFDAFGPGEHPIAWQEKVLKPIADSMSPSGILTTFCAQGAFKRTLRSLGLVVEALPGPPGKREMTRARKI